jgi:hypothetical protein
MQFGFGQAEDDGLFLEQPGLLDVRKQTRERTVNARVITMCTDKSSIFVAAVRAGHRHGELFGLWSLVGGLGGLLLTNPKPRDTDDGRN